MKKTKLFVGIGIGVLSLGMAVGGVLRAPEVTPAYAADTRTIYFNAGGTSLWDQAGAWFAAWTWGGSSADAWVKFADSDGDGIYEGELPSDRTNLKFVRMNPSESEPSWDDGKKWNESQNQTIPADKNCFKITDWDGNGTWSSYTPPTTPVIYDFYLVGTFNGWNPADVNYKFTYNEEAENYTVEVTLEEKAEFKVTQGDWSWSKGAGKFTSETVALTLTGSDNCVLDNAGAGTHDYLITLPMTFNATTTTGTIELNENDAEKVANFVATYMHMEDVSTDNLDDTGACKGETGYYALAKAAYQVLTASQKELFTTDATYAQAWARFQAWAHANGDVIDSNTLAVRPLTPLSMNVNNDYMLYIIIGVIAVSIIGLSIFVKRRRVTK